MSFPGFGFTALILCLTGVEVQGGSICALPGSTVVLPCSNKHPYSNSKWYFKTRDDSKQVVWKELVIHGRYTTRKGKFSLSIKDFRKTDAKSYCCTNVNVTKRCSQKNSEAEIHLADLQVKVLPKRERDKVSLTCQSSCRLSEEHPPAYIWYRDGAFLNESWSSWYKQLVSSNHTVRYSCAVKGFDHHRAPNVSVDNVTSACFTVTYAWGEMCLNGEQSVAEPCSITYPRELSVVLEPAEATEGRRVTLRCSTSCNLINSTAYLWYLDKKLLTWPQSTSQELVLDPVGRQHAGNYSCTLKTYKQIKSSEKTLVVRTNDWWVPAAAAGACAALIAIISLILYFWRRRKQTSRPPPSMQDRNSTELVNTAPVYENMLPQLRKQQHLPESATVLYANVQRSEPDEQEQVTYTVINFRNKPRP